jgi:hypothetical protein
MIIFCTIKTDGLFLSLIMALIFVLYLLASVFTLVPDTRLAEQAMSPVCQHMLEKSSSKFDNLFPDENDFGSKNRLDD